MKNYISFSPKLNEFSKKFSSREFLLVTLLFILGFILRAYLLNSNLFIGYEQGRDLLVVKDIVQNQNIVLIGPKTDIDGVFHGPIFYYLLTIPFLLSKGNPFFISIFLIFINSLSIYFIYLLGKELFNKRVGVFAATLLTFSFGSIVMARWLSNPPLIVPISCLLFYFLAKFLHGKKYYLIPVAIFYGFAGQVNFINYLIFGVILFIVFILFFKQFKKTPWYLLVLSLLIIPLLSIANYILFDIRHDFLVSNSLVNLVTGGKGYYIGYFEAFKTTLTNFSLTYIDLIFPINKIIALIIFVFSLISIFFYRNDKSTGAKILIIWILSPILVFVLLMHATLYHYFAAVIVALVICTALFVDKLFAIKKILGMTVIAFYIFVSLFYYSQNLPKNKNIFFQSTQPNLKYSDQIKVIENIYSQANGESFSFQAYTIPYWSPQGWEYLFWEYGQINNKYIPEIENSNQIFVIIQKDPNNSIYQDDWLKNKVSKLGKEEMEFSQGDLRVKQIKINQGE